MIDELPYNIKGNYEDNFFDQNKDLLKYSQIKHLIEEKGMEIASKVMWSFYFLLDPRSFIFDKMIFTDRQKFVIINYYEDFNFLEYKSIFEFYKNRIIVDEDILDFLNLKIIYERKVETDLKFTIEKAVNDKNSLIIYSQKSTSTLNKYHEDLYGEKNRYPRTIIGDPEEDNFFDLNKEVELFTEIKKLIADNGREIASKIAWSFYYVFDPKSFYYDKMNTNELKERCHKSYFKIDFDQYVDFEDFYREKILLTEDKVDYLELKKKYTILQSSNSITYTVANAQKDKLTLTNLKNKINKSTSNYKTIVIAGKKQPGLIARTRLA